MVRATLLLFLLLLPQDADKLIDDLGAADIDRRDVATARLKELGPAALDALRKRFGAAEPETRARLQTVIEEIERTERVRKVRPEPVRVSASLENVQVKDAIEKVVRPFGLQWRLLVHHSWLDGWTVSLDLKDSTLWQVLDALCAAGKLHCDPSTEGLCFSRQDGAQRTRSFDACNARLVASAAVFATKDRRHGDVMVRIGLLLPPGDCPMGWGLKELVVLTDAGAKLEVVDPGAPEEVRRWPCVTSSANFDVGRVARGSVKDCKALAVKGVAWISYPRKIDRVEVELKSLATPVTKAIAGAQITIRKADYTEEDGWIIEYTIRADPLSRGAQGRTLRLWIEDAKGRWLFDRTSIQTVTRLNAETSFNEAGRLTSLEKRVDAGASSLVIADFEGEDRVEFAFTIKDVTVPPAPGK